jgi:hypothetical protein
MGEAFRVMLALRQGEELLPEITRRLELPSRPIKFRQSRQYHEELRCVPHLLAQLTGAGVDVPNFRGREALGDLQRLTQRNLQV